MASANVSRSSFTLPNLSHAEILIMNREERLTPQGPVYSYESTPGLTTYSYFVKDEGAATGSANASETAPPYTFEHDREKGVYRLKRSDGEVEFFRDKPARYLVLEPDCETGELRPVMTRGYPRYLYLCREEREVR